jgi:hypothetical protein
VRDISLEGPPEILQVAPPPRSIQRDAHPSLSHRRRARRRDKRPRAPLLLIAAQQIGWTCQAEDALMAAASGGGSQADVVVEVTKLEARSKLEWR